MERIALVRATTGEMLFPEVPIRTGDDTAKVSQPSAINFSVAPEWETMQAHDGSRMIEKGKTLVVIESENRQIRNVGMVDSLDPKNGELVVGAGGFSMTAGQSGPWEGHQSYFVTTDPVTLFRRVIEQVQSYPNAIKGIRITGDTSSGSMVGYPGSRRWQDANQEYQRHKPRLDLWEGRLLVRERILAQRKEAMFKAAGLKRVGSVTVSDNEPDPPAYRADSTLWIHETSRRAYTWKSGAPGSWVAQPNRGPVRAWMDYRDVVQEAKDHVGQAEYLVAPAEELLEEYENEAREEYSLYFWQNHDLSTVIDELMALGPFEYREKAAWTDDGKLDLMLEVGAPSVGVRRDELHLEFGVNIQGDVSREYGPVYTGIAQFGAGSGSEVLSEQRDWNLQHVVRNILTETNKDAHTRALTRSAANKLRDRAQGEAGLKFSNLTIFHNKACPVGSFQEGDSFRIVGHLGSLEINQWVRVMEAKSIWGKDQTEVEVVSV